MKIVIIVVLSLTLAGLFYFAFLQYTGSTAYVRKDVDALNLSYRYSNDEFRTICDKMSPFSYVDGLTGGALGPIRARTYYYKSRCFQELALRTLNQNICARVVERKFLFADGSGFSEKECLKEVAGAKARRKQRDSEAAAFKVLTEGAFAIVNEKTKVEQVSKGSWKICVYLAGYLPGEYEFKIEQTDVRKMIQQEKVVIKKPTESFAWIINKTELKSSNLPGPARRLYHIAVHLTLLRSEDHAFQGRHLTSIGNVTIDVGE